MRVLQVVEATSGGVGRHVADLSQFLQNNGVEVGVLYSEARIDDRFRQFLQEFTIAGGHAEAVPMVRLPHPSDIKAIRLARSLLKSRYDLIHGHSFKGGLVARIAARRPATPAVYTPHGYYTMSPVGRAARIIVTRIEATLGKKGTTINVSEFERSHAIGLGVPSAMCRVIRNGVEPAVGALSKEEARKELDLPDSAFVFGYVGRFSDPKRPDIATRAFSEAAPLMKDGYLVMIGSGEQEARARECLQGQSADRTRWPGAKEGAKYLAAFDALLLTSDSEAMPYVILEALSAGVPVLATHYRGAEELIKERVHGMLSPVGDFGTLAANMLAVATDAQFFNELRANVVGAANEFSLQKMGMETMSLYKDSLAKKTGA